MGEPKKLCPGINICFPGCSPGKNQPAMLIDQTQFDSWVGKLPWRRAWQPTPVFLSRESPGTEVPGGRQSMGSQRVRHDLVTAHVNTCDCMSCSEINSEQNNKCIVKFPLDSHKFGAFLVSINIVISFVD